MCRELSAAPPELPGCQPRALGHSLELGPDRWLAGRSCPGAGRLCVPHVLYAVQRDPIQTAKQVASLDQVSAGRFLFGIGAGWNAKEMADHGTVFASRFKLMRERVEAMKAIWTQSKPEYHGELVSFPPMMTWPKPLQKPHPPVLVGGA